MKPAWADTWEEWQAQRARSRGITVEELIRADEKQQREEAVRRARQEEANTRESLLRAGVPLRTLESAEQPIDTPALREIWEPADLLVLAGNPGVGKSVAACVWLIRSSSTESYTGSWRWIQAGSIARGFAYDEDAFGLITQVHALVIDDLGIEYLDQKDRYLSTLEEILSARFANRRPTLLTTNLTPEKFKERYGERLVSRINEDGAFVVCGGEDLRRRTA